jgi:hypothetical protein
MSMLSFLGGKRTSPGVRSLYYWPMQFTTVASCVVAWPFDEARFVVVCLVVVAEIPPIVSRPEPPESQVRRPL